MGTPELPSDALRVKEVLKSMGVHEHEPRVLNQLMDFVYRYTADILQDAEAYSEHAGNPQGEVEMEDVRMAIRLNESKSFVSAPPQDVLLEIAEVRNKIPLPDLMRRHGLHLPSEEFCLTNPNYQVANPDPKQPKEQSKAEDRGTPSKDVDMTEHPDANGDEDGTPS